MIYPKFRIYHLRVAFFYGIGISYTIKKYAPQGRTAAEQQMLLKQPAAGGDCAAAQSILCMFLAEICRKKYTII